MSRALASVASAFVGFASVALVAYPGVTSAAAAELLVKAPPVPVAAFSWSGCYAGAHLGEIFGHFRNDVGIAGPTSDAYSPIAGGQGGCNWQSNNLVLGLEVDLSGFELKGNNAFVSFSETWQSTVRGRIGYTMGEYLLYATGGLALTGLNGSFTGVGSTSAVQAGGTIGAGLERVLWSPHWIGRIEYLYVDVPKDQLNIDGGFIRGGSSNNLGRVGISYKF